MRPAFVKWLRTQEQGLRTCENLLPPVSMSSSMACYCFAGSLVDTKLVACRLSLHDRQSSQCSVLKYMWTQLTILTCQEGTRESMCMHIIQGQYIQTRQLHTHHPSSVHLEASPSHCQVIKDTAAAFLKHRPPSCFLEPGCCRSAPACCRGIHAVSQLLLLQGLVDSWTHHQMLNWPFSCIATDLLML